MPRVHTLRSFNARNLTFRYRFTRGYKYAVRSADSSIAGPRPILSQILNSQNNIGTFRETVSCKYREPPSPQVDLINMVLVESADVEVSFVQSKVADLA